MSYNKIIERVKSNVVKLKVIDIKLIEKISNNEKFINWFSQHIGSVSMEEVVRLSKKAIINNNINSYLSNLIFLITGNSYDINHNTIISEGEYFEYERNYYIYDTANNLIEALEFGEYYKYTYDEDNVLLLKTKIDINLNEFNYVFSYSENVDTKTVEVSLNGNIINIIEYTQDDEILYEYVQKDDANIRSFYKNGILFKKTYDNFIIQEVVDFIEDEGYTKIYYIKEDSRIFCKVIYKFINNEYREISNQRFNRSGGETKGVKTYDEHGKLITKTLHRIINGKVSCVLILFYMNNKKYKYIDNSIFPIIEDENGNVLEEDGNVYKYIQDGLYFIYYKNDDIVYKIKRISNVHI